MRIQPLALALLLCACSPADEANNIAANANDAQPADVPIPNGSQSQQPIDGQAAPAPAGDIDFTVLPDSIPQGGTLTLTLANRSNELLGYNLCTSALQTADGAAVQTDRVCTMELRTLEAGKSATYSYEMPADVAPGSYRLSTNVQKMDSAAQLTVATGTFNVTAAG